MVAWSSAKGGRTKIDPDTRLREREDQRTDGGMSGRERERDEKYPSLTRGAISQIRYSERSLHAFKLQEEEND